MAVGDEPAMADETIVLSASAFLRGIVAATWSAPFALLAVFGLAAGAGAAAVVAGLPDVLFGAAGFARAGRVELRVGPTLIAVQNVVSGHEAPVAALVRVRAGHLAWFGYPLAWLLDVLVLDFDDDGTTTRVPVLATRTSPERLESLADWLAGLESGIDVDPDALDLVGFAPLDTPGTGHSGSL